MLKVLQLKQMKRNLYKLPKNVHIWVV